MVALRGRNGVGKTTTLTVMGAVKPTRMAYAGEAEGLRRDEELQVSLLGV